VERPTGAALSNNRRKSEAEGSGKVTGCGGAIPEVAAVFAVGVAAKIWFATKLAIRS
jgi:hypothetical protein